MKLTNKQLKQIIKEELNAVMKEGYTLTGNDLIDYRGYKDYLQSRRFIRGDMNSPLDGPWSQAENLKQALDRRLSAERGLEALNNIKMHIEQVPKHPDIPTLEKSRGDLEKFLEWAQIELEGM
jgi:hypothetical protein